MNKLDIINFGPKEISYKENNIWVVLKNITKNAKVYINNYELISCIDNKNNVITATIPKFIFNLDLNYSFYIYDEYTNNKSEEFTIKIIQNNTKETDAILYLKNENFKLNMELYKKNQVQIPMFEGWGMTTNHKNPWDDNYLLDDFRTTMKELKNDFIFGLEDSIGINKDNVETLNWRHYIVSFCTNYSLKFSNTNQYNFVECGVGDGMTAFVSLNEIISKTQHFSYHLYDAWAKIENNSLDKSESFLIDHYDDLDINRTKKNLLKFEKFCIYHKGFIPEIFDREKEISNINYLHIDLNSVSATISALDKFLPYMNSGSVILFDDYGWYGYELTKEEIDKYFSTKNGMLLKLPTGQAIYLCN